MLAVIYHFVGKKDVVINTADQKGGERHHKDELPVKRGSRREGITLLPPRIQSRQGHGSWGCIPTAMAAGKLKGTGSSKWNAGSGHGKP